MSNQNQKSEKDGKPPTVETCIILIAGLGEVNQIHQQVITCQLLPELSVSQEGQ